MDAVKPALTPEEWANKFLVRGRVCLSLDRPVSETGRMRSMGMVLSFASRNATGTTVASIPLSGASHALAALALHGTKEGFTREDVTMLRTLKLDHSDWQYGGEAQPTYKVLALAARIEALLPPEGK